MEENRPMDRRRFLGNLGVGVLCSATRPLTARRLARIGLDMRSVGQAVPGGLPALLERIAAIGYRDVEFWTPERFVFDPLDVTRVMKRLSLSAPSRLVPMADVLSNWRVTLNTCRMLGSRQVVCEEVPAPQRATLAGYTRVAELMNVAGKITQWAGIQLVVHQHVDDFLPRNGVVPFDYLASRTDATLVKFQMDLAVMGRVGREPLKDLARYSGRFASLRLSDTDALRQPVGLGQGRIDVAALISAAERAGVRHYFVGDPRPDAVWEHAAANFEYLARLEFE